MYENETTEAIFTRMLEKVSDSFDKREGSIIFDALKPAAIEVELLYMMCSYYLKNTFGDTAERSFLIERAKERGLSPMPATCAVGKGAFTPPTVTIPTGSRWAYEDVIFEVQSKDKDGTYTLICQTAGTVGNKPKGELLPLGYVSGVTSATLSEITVPGEDEEETEHFRQRYLASFDSQAYGGNIADYKEKVSAIAGVGGVKVYPVWKGGGTVRVVFSTSEYKPPLPDFVARVQTALDPVKNHGQGLGIAPIGHTVTVEGAKNSAISIGLHLAFSSGASYEALQGQIEKAIDDYFLSLNREWQGTQVVSIDSVSNNGIIVRISQLESRLLAIKGIVDVMHTTLNGKEENLTLGDDELAVRGDISHGA